MSVSSAKNNPSKLIAIQSMYDMRVDYNLARLPRREYKWLIFRYSRWTALASILFEIAARVRDV